jgi:hypothetical protein
MGWLLWGIVFGWGVCAVYYHSQTENNEKAANGATIICIALIIVAVTISINLGIESGAIPQSTPAPTSLGR